MIRAIMYPSSANAGYLIADGGGSVNVIEAVHRSIIELARLIDPDLLVEIEATAVVDTTHDPEHAGDQ